MKEELTKKIRPWNHEIEYTFEQWCIYNHLQDILDHWDYELNDGTYNNTPEQLEEYINKKRKQLGINIPFNIKNYQ